MSDTDLEMIKAGMAGVYERNAAAWDEGRDTSLYEMECLTRLLTGLPRRAKILDLGCGAGRPLAAFLAGLGHDVIGVDASPTMIKRARQNVPNASFQIMDMRDLELDHSFDAILSWDAFFHLSPGEQREALPRIARLLRPGGNLLLTVGWGEGEVTGTVAGEPVYHGSLSSDEYFEILSRVGFSEQSMRPYEKNGLGRWVLFAGMRKGYPARWRAPSEKLSDQEKLGQIYLALHDLRVDLHKEGRTLEDYHRLAFVYYSRLVECAGYAEDLLPADYVEQLDEQFD